jgi:hypothetical protein
VSAAAGSEFAAGDSSPLILVSIDRRLVEQLLPGQIADAELRAQGFADSRERRAWIAGRLGVQLEQLLPAVASMVAAGELQAATS